MRQLVNMAREALSACEECVMCTVVRLDGSGYGRPGARMLITESGEHTGYISGGCLENDLRKRAWSATAKGPRVIAFDTRGVKVPTRRYNSGCEGVVYVLCQRITSHLDLSLDALAQVIDCSEPAVLLTVYRSSSAEFNVGDAARIDGGGNVVATSPTLIERLAALGNLGQSTFRHRTIEWRDRKGAIVEAACEMLEPPTELVIFGAGDDAACLARSARLLDWNVTVITGRAEQATPARFAGCSLRFGIPQLLAASLPVPQRSWAVLMTHDCDIDASVIPALLDTHVPSIGILGSKPRLARLVHAMHERERSITPQEADRLRSPIGLDIGASTPEEIAASIVAELLALARQREGGFLTRRRGPLHDHEKHHRLPPARVAVALGSPLPLVAASTPS